MHYYIYICMYYIIITIVFESFLKIIILYGLFYLLVKSSYENKKIDFKYKKVMNFSDLIN